MTEKRDRVCTACGSVVQPAPHQGCPVCHASMYALRPLPGRADPKNTVRPA